MTLSRFFVGLIGIPLGFIILYYRVPIKDFTGNFGWAEKYLGIGGTWTALVLIGLMISIGSFLWMFGVLQDILISFLSPLFF